MSIQEEQKKAVVAAAQGAMSLNLAFIGVSGGLFDALASGPASTAELAARAGADHGYVLRWSEAAFAFGLLDQKEGLYSLTELGAAFRPSAPDSLMPFAVQSVLGAHMAERTATLLKTGERPGEEVLAERPAILPWFGPMLESTFGAFFERQILPSLEVFRSLEARAASETTSPQQGPRGGVAVDLGCGNGWYLRKLAARYPHVTGIGLDGFDEPVSLLAMNRALHHVWDRKDEVFAKLRDALQPGGAVVIWEPRWPDDLEVLRDPRRRALAYQNLGEHVQGNHFLRPAEIEAAMRAAGLAPETFLFAEGAEAVVVGVRR